MSFEYLKLNRSYLTDVKFLKLPDATKWHYWGCCLIAGEAKAEGYIAQNHNPMDIEDIALVLRCDFEEFNKSFHLLLDLDFIIFDNGFYYIKRFLDEQGPAERKSGDTQDMRGYWAEAQQKHRKKLNKVQYQEKEIPAEETPPVELQDEEESSMPF
jgi:hypothetical protein